jgi:hypothetical protein
MSINRAGTAGAATGSPHENPRRYGQRCNATYWCHARSPITGVRSSNDSNPGRIRRDLPYSGRKLIAAAGPAGCGNAAMIGVRAGIHGLENLGRAPNCTNRLYAALMRLALQNYLLTLGHNRTHLCHLGVSGFKVRGLGEVRGDALMKPVRKGASGPGDAVSATDAACNAAPVFAALTRIHVTEVRLRKRGRRRDRNSRGVG